MTSDRFLLAEAGVLVAATARAGVGGDDLSQAEILIAQKSGMEAGIYLGVFLTPLSKWQWD